MATTALPDAPPRGLAYRRHRAGTSWSGCGVGLVAVVTVLLRSGFPLASHAIPQRVGGPLFADWINAFMAWFVPTVKWLFRALNWLLTWPMDWLR